MSTVGAMSGTFATIFSLEKSRKWIIRDGLKGISRAGSGASIARGLKKSRGLRKSVSWVVALDAVTAGPRTTLSGAGPPGLPDDGVSQPERYRLGRRERCPEMRSELWSMRRAAVTTLPTLALIAGLVVMANTATAATGTAFTHFSAPTQTGRSERPAAATGAGAKAHTWSLRLAPAPDDLALAQIRFPRAGRRAVARALLHIEIQAPFGADYLAVAAPSISLSTAGAQVLVLLVNRPTALEDPVSVRLRLSTGGRLAEHQVRRVENPFAETPSPATRDLCDLATRGPTLQGSDLTPLRSAGAPLAEFGVAAAVAQA